MARASDPIRARHVAVGIVRRLREAGHAAYFAGGCVRDELLGLHPTDFDVATDATPVVVRSLFPRTAEVGAAFGVVLVNEGGGGSGAAPGVSVEVATFRSDGPYTDARRPDAVHFSDPISDAQRRDFTINALFLDPLAAEGSPQRIIDHVGGRGDLAAGILRAVGDPDKRLAEDHLRALRAVRFAARLNFQIDPATADAIRRHAAELRGVSRERIGDELRRMFAQASTARAVELLQSLTLDGPVLNEPHADVPLPVIRAITDATGAVPAMAPRPMPSFSLVLAGWALDRHALSSPHTRDVPALVRRWRPALCLSNDEAGELADILVQFPTLADRWSTFRVAQRKRTASAGRFAATLRLLEAVDPQMANRIREDVERLSSDGVGIQPPPFVDGDELIRLGYKPGPAFGRVLDETYDAQLEGRILTLDQARELVRKLYV